METITVSIKGQKHMIESVLKHLFELGEIQSFRILEVKKGE